MDSFSLCCVFMIKDSMICRSATVVHASDVPRIMSMK